MEGLEFKIFGTSGPTFFLVWRQRDLIEFDHVNWRQMHLCCATCQKICLGQIQKVKGCMKNPWNFALSLAKKQPSKSQIKIYEKFVKVCLYSSSAVQISSIWRIIFFTKKILKIRESLFTFWLSSVYLLNLTNYFFHRNISKIRESLFTFWQSSADLLSIWRIIFFFHQKC